MRQAVEQSIQIIERRVNELGTVEPMIQRQGVDRILVQVPGLQDPQRAQGAPRQDREARLPHGRPVDRRRSRRSRAGCRRIPRCSTARKEDRQPYRDREARDGVRRGPDRRAAGLRPAHQRADRHLPLQHQRRAQLRAGDAGECRPAVRHRARQRGDLGAGDPRADPRRLGQISGNFTVQSANDLAILLRAGALPAPLTVDRGAHGRRRPRPGFDRQAASARPMSAPRWSSSSCS